MSDQAQRIDRALRVTPRSDRDRYEAEWRHDLAEAESNGLSPRDVERGAFRVAIGLRARQIERVFLWRRGAAAAFGAWLALLGLMVLAGILGGLVLLVAALVILVLIGVLARAGTPSHVSHWLMVTSVALGSVSAAFVWWAAGAKIDAADALTAEPAAAAWGGVALIICAVSLVTLIVSAVIAVTRESHRQTR
jgi:hypothetical protein